jgi:hypothetical protein
MAANDDSAQSPDDLCGERSQSAQIELRLIHDDESVGEPPTVLVRGTPETLTFIADLLLAVAHSPRLPARFHLSPNGAGQFHFAESAECGLYIECITPPAPSNSETTSP